jgi:hypothetical protein
VTAQRKIFEFRNQLDILNEEIEAAMQYHQMTFDASLSELNHQRVTEELYTRYGHVQTRAKITVDKVEAILAAF